MRSHSYLNTAKKIIQSFDGSIPFAGYLKQFFKADKKFGSKDRKQISHACYCFYRLGRAFQNSGIEEKILTGLFLCSDTSNKILEELRPAWNEKISVSIPEKIDQLTGNEISHIFPFADETSTGIDLKQLNLSFLIQPHLYLRTRPGKMKRAAEQLQKAGMEFSILGEDCIQLSNQSKVDEILNIDEDVVIQDYNSQKTIELLNTHELQTASHKLSMWDCCAASGGKSILFHDHFPGAFLTVSDIRKSILINLQNRFKRAGVQHYSSFVDDLSSKDFKMNNQYDVVICDAPCSGSGTWSRTPEQLSVFKKEKIDEYSGLQKKIAVNAAKGVKKNGFFLYITCSVFKKENEEVVEWIQRETQLQFQSMHYLKGYDKKADTLFVALFFL